jgi:glutaredoxin 3
MTAKVEIYATSSCRHCVAARELLDSLNVEYAERRLDLLPLERDEMIRRCGLKSVPQIFINGVHIGGHEELLAMKSRGDLDRLLER